MTPATDLTDGRFQACLFDMDGVLTDTASVHAAAWKQTFDDFLRERAASGGPPFVPFEIATDYVRYVDGKPRNDGVRGFLESRGISLPEGSPDDKPGADTIWAVGNRKNQLLLDVLGRDGVNVYEGSVQLIHHLKDRGIRIGVVSASANTPAVLDSAGIASLFEVRVDGNTIVKEKLAGKPAPDTFLRAAELLDVDPSRAVVFEDALAGVAAGHAGKFGLVVGVNRADQRDALLANGADIVVDDLSELLPDGEAR